jgi:DNA invertase Pin-like site-specific DNA recombinase
LATIIGYARVSTTDQDLTVQDAALKAAGCTIIRAEKRSGTTTAGRTELATILEFLREGDTLVVTRIDRLARSMGDLQDIVRAIKAKGASLRATEQPIDTSTAAGKAFLDMLGVFAEFETNLRRERQLEGIAKAKAEKIAKPKAPRKVSAGYLPSADLANVIGAEAVARTEVIKKLWDYIKANGLQDATNKRAINADAKLKPVFGKDQVTMFELAGIAGKHLRPIGE